MEWIDAVLLSGEAELQSYVSSLDEKGRRRLKRALLQFLSLEEREIEEAILRILIERTRPLVLPSALWTRSTLSSTNVKAMASGHFEKLHISATAERLAAAQTLYAQFSEDRVRAVLTPAILAAQRYRCVFCGLAFCDPELQHITLTSPYRRSRLKTDPFKVHWQSVERRKATLEHTWPIATYGDNVAANLSAACASCNGGKKQFLAHEQTRPYVGVWMRKQFASTLPLSEELFYAQMRRQPRCHKTGKGPMDTELTVELLDPEMPPVLDNLQTIESPGI